MIPVANLPDRGRAQTIPNNGNPLDVKTTVDIHGNLVITFTLDIRILIQQDLGQVECV
jgi:hypothetical protein